MIGPNELRREALELERVAPGLGSAPFSAAQEIERLRNLRDAVAELQALPDDVHWHFARGRIAAGEPLYGLSLYRSCGGVSAEDAFAIGEHDDPLECVRRVMRDAGFNSVQ